MLTLLVGFVAAVAVLLFGLFVLFDNPRNPVNQAFSSFSIFFGFWALCLVFYSFPIIGTSELWIRLTYVFSIFGAVAILHTVKVFPNKDKHAKMDTFVEVLSSLALSPFLFFLAFTHLFVDYTWQEGTSVLTRHGAAYPFFYAVIIPIIIYGMTRQALRRRTFTGLERTQYSYFFVGMCLFGGIAVVTDILMPLAFGTTQYFALSPLAVLPLTLINTYLVIQYRLMDLRLAIKFIATRLLLFVIFALPLFLIMYFYSGFTLLLDLGLLFAPVLLILLFENKLTKIELGEWLAKIVYKKEKSKEEQIAGFAKRLTEEVELNKIVDLVQKSMEGIFYSKKVSLLDEEELPVELALNDGLGNMVVYEELKIGLSHPNIKDDERAMLVRYKDEMAKMGVDIVRSVNPSAVVAKRMYLLVGEKEDLSLYTKEDIALVESLSLRIATALEVAQLVESLEHDKVLISAERNKLAMALAGVSDSVIALDHQRNVVVANPAAYELFSLKDDPVGLGISDLGEFISPNEVVITDDKLCPSEINEDHDEVVFSSDQVRLKRDDGTIRNIRLQVSTIKEAKKSDVAYIFVVHDFTAEEELERMKLDFVAMAAHELRTPLTSMKGYLSLFRQEYEDKKDEQQGLLLGRIETSTQQLVGLMENLLSVSQIEQGEFNLNLEDSDWVQIVGGVIDQLSEYARERNLELRWKEPKTEIPAVAVDKLRIVEVLNNLISNGLKYTKEGHVEVTVEYDKDQDVVITHVVDTGEGIPPDAIKHMFEKFFRVWGQLEMGSKGTGLGLYIARSIVEMHHGKIWVVSEGLGKGSTFSFSLPVAN
ncbi:hypothetical protein KC614_00155 [candidate division WWE3 bacterium]|uniref:histidine kinase n=1 Tax=candidate division WWE3 bacterium TaxID=2053526 RepID=A0A955RRK2_UNCKA|nr:hypothetical protein [candidate division WWE3 bacterium]